MWPNESNDEKVTPVDMLRQTWALADAAGARARPGDLDVATSVSFVKMAWKNEMARKNEGGKVQRTPHSNTRGWNARRVPSEHVPRVQVVQLRSIKAFHPPTSPPYANEAQIGLYKPTTTYLIAAGL